MSEEQRGSVGSAERPRAAVGRFAPSTTGDAHPGTLLSALLAWLDARSLRARFDLRFEDLDPARCRPAHEDALRRALEWLGLDWDREVRQSAHADRYHAVLATWAEEGRLYACHCSRSTLAGLGERAPDGSARYPNTCRRHRVKDWRASALPLRVELPEGDLRFADEGGHGWEGDVARHYGDPVVRRRDGAVAYHLACVLDDAAQGVTRVVRGRDLAWVTPVHLALQGLLGLPAPRYRHHLLLLEERGGKLAKAHGSFPVAQLRTQLDGPGMLALLAKAMARSAYPPGDAMRARERTQPAQKESSCYFERAVDGVRWRGKPAGSPHRLLEGFSWAKVSDQDCVIREREGKLDLEVA